MKTSPNTRTPFGCIAVAESLLAYPAVLYADSTTPKCVLEGIFTFISLIFVCKSAVFRRKKSLCNCGRAEQNFRTSGKKFPDVKKFISARQEKNFPTSRNFTADVRNFLPLQMPILEAVCERFFGVFRSVRWQYPKKKEHFITNIIINEQNFSH